MEEEEREAPPKEVPEEDGASPPEGEDTCQIDRPPGLHEGFNHEGIDKFDFLDPLAREAADRLMDMVNAVEGDLLPRSMDFADLGPGSVLPYQVTQRAVIQRRKLLDVLDVYGVEPIDEVGVTVSFDRHFPGQERIVDDPSLHGVVSVCMLTGFMRGGVVFRPACVEVMRHIQDNHKDEQVDNKETTGKED